MSTLKKSLLSVEQLSPMFDEQPVSPKSPHKTLAFEDQPGSMAWIASKPGKGAFETSNESTNDDNDDNDDEDEDLKNDSMFITLPPLATSNADRKSLINKKMSLSVKLLDILGINIGSVLYVTGSVYFYPGYAGDCGGVGLDDCATLGSWMFIAGSVLFLQGSLISFFHSGGFEMQDKLLLINAVLYLVANSLFLLGSIISFPTIAAKITVVPGLILYLIGSLMFFSAPVFNIFRAIDMRRKRTMRKLHFRATVIIASLYIVGSLGFIVGIMFFMPGLYRVWSVTIFVWGSVTFFVATLMAPLKYSWLCLNRSALKRTRSAYPVGIDANLEKYKRSISEIEQP